MNKRAGVSFKNQLPVKQKVQLQGGLDGLENIEYPKAMEPEECDQESCKQMNISQEDIIGATGCNFFIIFILKIIKCNQLTHFLGEFG